MSVSHWYWVRGCKQQLSNTLLKVVMTYTKSSFLFSMPKCWLWIVSHRQSVFHKIWGMLSFRNFTLIVSNLPGSFLVWISISTTWVRWWLLGSKRPCQSCLINWWQNDDRWCIVTTLRNKNKINVVKEYVAIMWSRSRKFFLWHTLTLSFTPTHTLSLWLW